MTEKLDEVNDAFSMTTNLMSNFRVVGGFVGGRKEITAWFSLEKSPKLADIWIGKFSGAPALDPGTLLPYAETNAFTVIPAMAVFYPLASLRNCISGTGKCSGLE